MLDQTSLLLEFQRLDEEWDRLEKKLYSNDAILLCDDIQQLIERIWEKQVEILNLIIKQ
jgi:hypothetical protein